MTARYFEFVDDFFDFYRQMLRFAGFLDKMKMDRIYCF